MKWMVLTISLIGDLLLVASLIVVAVYLNWVLAIILAIPTYCAWKSVGGIKMWKLKMMKQFLHNWDEIVKE